MLKRSSTKQLIYEILALSTSLTKLYINSGNKNSIAAYLAKN